MNQDTSTYRAAAMTERTDSLGRPLNDQGFAPVDEAGIEEAVRAFLLAIGEDPEREGLAETPARVARACRELLSGMQEDPRAHLGKQFREESATGLVVVRDIPFESFCEHHILPFRGTASVVYLPRDGRICGLSKLGRLVQGYAHRLQVQERLTAQVADALMEEIAPEGVLVTIRAEHMCMSMRGVKSVGSTTATEAVRGRFADEADLRAEAWRLIGAQER